jgi:hypothetical protein
LSRRPARDGIAISEDNAAFACAFPAIGRWLKS